MAVNAIVLILLNEQLLSNFLTFSKFWSNLWLRLGSLKPLYMRNQDRQTLSSITNFCWNLEQLRRDRHLKGPTEKLEA